MHLATELNASSYPAIKKNKQATHYGALACFSFTLSQTLVASVDRV